jgi:hypothetical protein
MSMAMASILKVFLMRKKEDKGCSAEQRRRGREWVKGRVNWWGGASSFMHVLQLGWR